MTIRPRALTALTRFGLGPRPGDYAMIADDPVGYVTAQCMEPEAALIAKPPLDDRLTLREGYGVHFSEVVQARKAMRKDGTTQAERDADEEARADRRKYVNSVFRKEILARVDHGIGTDHPFLERLVLFWSNHFAINRRDGGIGGAVIIGNFEREAIRPNVLGYFEDMLAAVTMHPSMLIYLDNNRNIGPNSRIGKRRKTPSINENLARELLELHTLGAGGGYTQADIIELAKVLTGWLGGFGASSTPTFAERFHEIGKRTILGNEYPQTGAAQLEAVLPDLAMHPSTARHIAEKFARHFVGDAAPEPLIAELEDAFLVTGGDLRELALVLLESEHAWVGEPVKTVPPYDFMIAAMRATNAERPDAAYIQRVARDLAQPLWEPPSPAGWPDDDGAFLGGDSLLERIDFCRQIAYRFAKVDRTQELAKALFGEALDPFVAEAIDRAEDQSQALVLLLMSPAFHRR